MAQTDHYSLQLRSGFRMLRFEPPLEAEFRAQHLARGGGFLSVSLGLGLALLAVPTALDWRAGAADLAPAALIRLAFMAPPAALALLALHARPLARHLPRLLLATGAAFGAGGALLALLPPPHALEGAALTLFVYLLLGLRFPVALALTLPLTSALVISSLRAAGGAAAGDCALVVAVAAVGALAGYRLEHAARTLFLEREIVNLLAGTDIATGIANRRLFATHLQRIRRQANRDKRALALLLVEIGRCAEFEAAHGRLDAEAMMRRVAHALTRGARRPLDCAARLGGAQFAIALYDAESAYVERLAADLREGVALLDIAHAGAPRGVVGVSIGVALSPPDAYHDPDAMLRLAAQALEAAKDGTRDGIVVRSVLQPDGPTVTTGPWRARLPS